jgi:3-hydroxy-9,10-secoandrosta-1,3,5(10)-triene-9,17-dione monooxygenase
MALRKDNFLIHPDEFIARARNLQSVLKDRAKKTRQDRKVPVETIQALKDAEFFRMMRPKKWGGYEMNPKYFYDVVFEIARVCPSTGWVLSVVGVHDWQMALLDDQAAKDVWGDDLDTLVCSSYMPTGKTTEAEGGVIFNGTWNFSSGCDHAKWAFLGGLMSAGEGPVKISDMKSFLIPSSDFRIVDDWHTTGLQGSGSKTITVKDAFVPSYRIHGFKEGFECNSPGIKINTAPIFKLPFGQVFIRAVSMPAVGAAQGALDAYCEYNKSRLSSSGVPASSMPASLHAATVANSTIRTAKLKMHDAYDSLLKFVHENKDFPDLVRSEYRYDAAEAVTSCVAAVQDLLSNSGGRAIHQGNAINEFSQDMQAFRQHAANQPHALNANLGAVLFGESNSDHFS